ncbi:unnamed protein product, partial [marine sediment metagenome]
LRLISAQLNMTTAPLFSSALADAFTVASNDGENILSLVVDVRSLSDEIKKAYRDLFVALKAKKKLFLETPPNGSAIKNKSSKVLDALNLGIGVRGELTSDDTYVYCRAMKEVKESLEALPEKEGWDRSSDPWDHFHRRCLLDCLETSW